MIRSPYPGQRCRVWYAKGKVRRSPASFPWHAREGVVVIVARGPGPRNVGVRVGREMVVVPKGNLNAV